MIENKVQENIAKLSSKITIQEESYFTTITIDSNITSYLLLSANQVFHTEVNDLLLTALARALGKLFNEQEISILLEGHGRESLQDDIDISKTMGWFTSIVPIHLPIHDDVQESIIEVKEELRRIPNKGIGYGFIRGYKHLPKISFNYLGVFKKEEQQDWFLTNESSGMSVSNKNKSNLWLDINGGVGANGVLGFSIRGRLTKEYIDNLSIYFKQEMIVITNYIQSVNRSYLTTSDTNYILSKDLLNRLQIDNEIQAIYVANSLQAGFIYHYLSKSKGDDAYKVQLLWKYKSQVNEDYFIQSWQQVLDRYPGLRVRFNWEEEIVQIIDKKITLDYRFRDIQDKRNKEKAIEGIRIVDRKEDYDLAKGNLLRVYLIQVDKEEFVVLYSNHHAISDGWSNPNLLNYIHEVYNSLINQNTPVELLEEQAYLRAQEYLQVKSKKDTHDRWWVDYLSGVERTIEVRGLRKQEANGINLLDYKFIQEPISKGVKIRDKEYRALSSFIKQEGLTWSNLIMWCWSKALSIYDNRHENIIGITLSGRGLPINDIEQSVGLYINTLPLVVRHDSNESILNILKNIQKDTEQLNQLTHTHLSGLHSNVSDRLFATMVVYENYPIPTNKDNQEVNTLVPIFLSSVEKTDYSLTVLAYEKDGALSVEVKYAGELFEEKQIERLLKLMSLLLQQIPIGYNKLEQELILIDNEEYNYLVYDYNKTERDYPKDKTIHQLFEEQVARTPNNIAVVFEEKQLTYQELNNKANQLAYYLHNNYQTKADDIICLLLERSEWMIVAILGVFKSGAAYCPISPEYPEERILFILQDTQSKCLITNCKLKIENIHFLIVNLMDEQFLKELYSLTINHLRLTISSHSLAYIIYTSGTTGNPKGVMIEHGGVINLIYALDKSHFWQDEERMLNFFSYIFDPSVEQFFIPLLKGFTLFMISEELIQDVDGLISFINKNEITHFHTTPSYFNSLPIVTLPTLNRLILGGERVTNEIRNKVYKTIFDNILFLNEYGPTETTITSLVSSLNNTIDLNIGSPISNTCIYILNKEGLLLPQGFIGELYIGGDGVARGYLNRPELTAERFIQNPFQTEEDKKKDRNSKLYKTGDIVRMLPDGNIEYIGRNDFQAKIRGYRIELGEIENRIQGFQTRIEGFQDFRMIEQAVVLVNKKAENKYLVGYFVAREQVDVEELRIYLSKQLPDYMVPIGLVQIDRIPLTVNGKLDRKALLAIEYNLTDSKEYKAPKNELEQQLLSIWEKLLGNNSIGVQDDFFRVGGDSIKSIQLSSRVRSELGKELSVKDVFEHRTIERMVSHVLSNHQIKVYLSEQGKLSGELSLLPIQQYFFELKLTNEHHYNQSFLIESPELEIEKLKMAIEKIVEQHDAFRLSYRKDTDGNIIQYYDSEKEAIPLDVLDISEWNVQEGTVVFEEKLKRQYTSWQDSFNIYEGKTYQMAYIWGYKNKTARIFIAAHHLIIDAVSWRILLEDIEIVYKGKKLLAKRTSYRQWVNIGKDYVAHYPNELSYWEGVEKKVQENIAKLSSKITIQEEDYITTIAIDSDIINYLLLSANQVFHTEVNDLLLTALARALGKLFNEQEISILLEGHGRESLQDDIDISKTMGWFTSIVPIHLPIYDNVQESIIEVKEELRRIPNKGIGYGFIRGYKHLPKISFNYLGVFKKEEQQDWFLTNESSGMSVSNKNKSNLWLDINGGVGANGVLGFSIRGRLTKEYIDNLSIYFKQEMIVITNYIQSVNRSYLTTSDTNYILSKDLLNRLQIDNEIQAIYVANSLQAGFIYHYLSKSEGDDAYKVQLLWKYKSQVNEDYFIQSWQQALDRYPGLRVRFNWEETIVQIIDKKATLDYRFRDIQDKRNKEKAIETIRIEDRKEDYDLAKGNLLRVYLIQVDKEEFVVLYSNHHAISDGWSNPNLLNYIHEVYNSLINQNTPVELLEDQAYLRAQEYLQLQSKKYIYSKWWVDYLSGVERTIEVRGLRKQEANGINLLDYKFIQEPISKGVKIRDKEYRALSSFIKQEGLTWSNLIMWCWSKALSVYDNRNDNIIGITLSGRSLPINDIEQSVGLYINTLPLVVRHDSNESILNILKNIQKDTEQLNQLTHTHLSSLHSNASDRLFATMVVYENYPRPTNKDNQDAHALLPIFLSSVEKTDYPLTVLAYEKDSVLSVEIKYAGELFEEKQIERLLKLMSLLLQQIPICYNKLEQELILIDNEEYNYLVYDYNKTEKEYPKDKTIHQLFEEQVARTPNNIAVVFEDKKLTYQELNSKANQLANYLYHNYNTKADDIICLLLERSEWMIIAILGVLKSGVAYCPISPEYPEERVLFILQDTQPKCLITNCKLKIENVRVTIVNVTDEQFLKELYSLTINHLPLTISSHSLAYIIYTSGTTGNPKGVMVEHKNVVNLLYATAYILYPINQTYLRASAFTSYQFDVSVSEFLSPLVQGGELHIFNELAIRNISFLSQYIIEKSINYLYIPPVLLSQLPQHIYPELKHIIYAGEPCNRNIANDCSKNYFLFNYYGPTEATIYALGKQINIDEVEQIGKPIYNIKIYLLNTKLQVVPIGSIGELYIGGDGVARGYLNRPELTAERFIKNPFQTEEDKKKNRNSRLYKTGDIVRMLPDGNIEYIGRNDFQVKIRGYRIELGEIETRIQGFQTRIEGFQDFRMIEQAVVLVNKKADNKYLVGYFVSKEQVDVEELRSYLSKQLPDYMVPTGLLQIEQMPLTVNGKLDRKALLAIEYNLADSKEYKAPTNELEQQLLSIWEKLLGNNSIGVQDDFFRVGGDSIKSIQLSSRVRSELGKELSVKDVFEHRTIERMVSHVLSNHQIKVYLSEQGKLSGELNLLPIQQYFFELKLTNEHHYNQSFLIESPELEIEKLKMAIEKIVEQHDAFRLSYRKDTDGNIIQYYDSKKEAIPLDVLDISEWNVQEGTVVFEEKLKKQYTSWQDGFNIYEGKTYQMAYIWGYKNKTARIFIAAHHLIIDAVSWRILLEDIETVYTGKKLLAKRTSYRQWANLGKDYVAHYPNELSYWEGVEKKVQENIAKLSSKITIQEESYFTTITIDNNITNYLLLSANQVFHTEVNDLLLTALARALGKLFNEQEISILLEGHGRESLQDDIDISKTMGWFTSIVPIHLPIHDDVQESIIEVKEELRRIPNKGIGYGFIRGYKHLPKISFNYLGVFKKEEQQDWFLTNESSGMSVSNKNKSNLWLDINGGVFKNGILEFSIRGRLTKEYIDNLSIYFKQEMIVITNYIQSVNRSYLTPSDTNYIVSKDLLNRLQIDNEIQAIYVANSLQAGFIYHYLSKSEGDDAYKVQLLWKYKSQVNEDYFIQSWQQALDRYPGLRVRFNWEEEIVQIIDKKITLDYRFRDIQDKRNKEKAIEGIRIVDRKEDYDLAKGNLLRVYLIQVDKEEFVVLYSNHHAISDGWSNPNLLNYIHEVYNSLINQNTPVELLEDQAYLRVQEYLQVKSKNNTHDRWWVDYLSGVERTIEVRGLRKQDANGINLLDYKFIQEPISKGVKIRDKEYRALSSFIKQEGLTWSNLIMWCWSKALSVYDNRNDNIIGITLSGRNLPINDIEQSVGLYINTLPLVVRHDSNESILNILKNIQKDTEQLNQLTYTNLSSLNSNTSDRLFATMVVYENYPIPTNKDNQEVNTLVPIFLSSVEKTDYPLTVLSYEKDSVLSVEIKYAGELFEEKQIERLLKLMSLLLQQIPICYNKLEQELILIDNEEYNYLVYDYNKTEKEYPKDKTIHQLFEEQVARTPNNIAVVFDDKQLTYHELNSKANQLANYLYHNYNTKADDIICLLLERSEWMIIAILGVLKSGSAYCPISPEYPEERILFILQDTQPKCLITNCKLKIENVQFPIVNVTDEQFLKKLYSLTINHLPLTISSRSLAYIIYTSGTTGNPKGVMVEHKNVVNLLYATAYILYPINQTYLRASAFTSYQFDVSVSEFLSPLVQGGELHIFNELAIRNISFLSQYIIEKSINYLYIPPVLLSQLPQYIYPELKHIIYAGEPCNRNIANDCSKNYLLFNYYGPTEATIYALGKQINIDEVEQIGKPIYNIKIYLLNTKLQVVPIGSIGELYIGGDGVARGYLNRPELTAERFIKNPFQTEEGKKKDRNSKLYKTGDVVRMLPDGNIEYIGRNDFQVKIRGYRIELGEIEIMIQGFQTRIEGLKDEQVIEQAVVLVNEKGDNKYLVGYFVAKEQVDVEELRSYLSKQLPDYMVPTGLLQIEKMPLTINGKLDRKILLDMNANFVEDNIEAPTNNLELRMLQIFATLLLLEPNTISVNNSFFRLGGNSILSIRLASILNREFGTFLSVVDIFKYPTIRELALQANYKKTSFDLVLMLNNSIVKQAIYMIHPGGAGAEVYYNMAYRLQESYICYGIGNYNLFSDNKMSEISLLAKYYLHEIKNNTTIEPCILLGWSLGGKIALEMAYHLEQQGIKDIIVYLLDTTVMDETLTNILNKKDLSFRKQALNELLDNLNVGEDYKQRILANRSIEEKLNNDALTGKLIYSRCVLFKAMLSDKDEIADFFQYKLSLPYNNVDKYVPIENIQVIEMQVSHQDIIKKEDEIVDVIKQRTLLKDANKEL